jgi:hypothetical protein
MMYVCGINGRYMKHANFNLIRLVLILGIAATAMLCTSCNNCSPMDSFIKGSIQSAKDSVAARQSAQQFIDSINHK